MTHPFFAQYLNKKKNKSQPAVTLSDEEFHGTAAPFGSLAFLSPSGDLGIGLVWDNPGPDRLFGLTVEILFKLNLII